MQSNIKLSRVVVDKLKEWNKNKNDCEHDTKFVRLLLLSIFTSNVLRDHNGVAVRDLDEKKLRFTRGLIHDSSSSFSRNQYPILSALFSRHFSQSS